MLSKDIYQLFLGLFLVVAVAVIILLATRVPLIGELTQVAMLFAGMFGIAALSVLSRFIEGSVRGPLVQITFNEARTRQVLRDTIDADYVEVSRHDYQNKVPWEPTSDSLLAQDTSLALAKLRIDLERELRRIAYEKEIPFDARRLSIPRLTEALLNRHLLTASVIAAINDVMPACNQAIHGAEVAPELAQSVINVGEELLNVLRGR